jgi:hypothetical protein
MRRGTWREGLAELRRRAEPGRAEGGESRPSLRQFGIGGKAGHLALPERDPVFRQSVEIVLPSHQAGL